MPVVSAISKADHSPLVTRAAARRPPGTPDPCSPPTACTRSHRYSAYGYASQSSSYSGHYNAVCDFVFSGQKAWRSLSTDGPHKRSNVSGQWRESISSASPDDDQHPRCRGNETTPSPRADTDANDQRISVKKRVHLWDVFITDEHCVGSV